MSRRDWLIAGLYVGAIWGYAVAKSGADKKIIASVSRGIESMARTNAEIAIDTWETRLAAMAFDNTNTINTKISPDGS
jgi:hypothetical protein